ncbi:MAG: hypothetical protein KC800_13670, partial [Candidatus Eremiobacteraeota bacterium]|nr:hypothetical protein [Candidatus Eremiobacteraeota bacterium]
MTRLRALCLVVVTATWGYFLLPRYPSYFIPPFEGALPLRMEILEETLYEEFPVHSQAYYEERNLAAREAGETDDLAVGLDILGRSDEAALLLRSKLAEQLEAGISERGLYTTYANLGTALIHQNFPAAVAGEAEAIEGVREGREFIAKSVEVNPQAHFGREQWQLAIVGFILEAIEKPALLLQRDCLGNALDPARPVGNLGTGGTFMVHPSLGSRDSITRIGQPEVAFDEPLLGIIGMWQVGGGANPHFSLAVAETLDRVGELKLAWVAYQRTRQMKERFWPDPEIQRAIDDYCATRQGLLEQKLGPRENLV